MAAWEILIPKRTSWGKVLILCMMQTVLQYLFFYIGLARATGVKASIIEGVNVFCAILVASLLFHQETLNGRKIIGSIIGFAGVVLVNLTGGGLDLGFTFLGERFIFLSAVAYSLWGILLKYNPVSKVAVFGFMNPVCGVILSAVLLGETDSLSVMSVAALVLVCMGIYIVNHPKKAE